MHEARYFRARIPTIHYIPVGAPGRSAPDTDPMHIHAPSMAPSPSPISAAPSAKESSRCRERCSN